MELSDWETFSYDSNNKLGRGKMDPRERHKLAERERRKSMRELFLSLHVLLPHANTVRKEQSAILDEIIKYLPLAAARLRSLQNQMQGQSKPHISPSSSTTPSPSIQVSGGSNSTDCDIKVAPEPCSSVSIRVRGDKVNVSLTDTKGSSNTLLMSAVIDELEVHNLELVRSTHCRDGNKVLHHSESKICGGLETSPALLKVKLQELAGRLHRLRNSSANITSPSSRKRSFDQLN